MKKIITIIGFKDMKKPIIFIHSNICTIILSQSIKTTTTILFMVFCQFLEIEPINTLLEKRTIIILKLKIVEA
jgi:hypothetical protein